MAESNFQADVERLETIILEQDINLNGFLYNPQTWDVAIATIVTYGREATIYDIMKGEDLWEDGHSDGELIFCLKILHPYWVDVNSIVESGRNLLNPVPADADWKASFNKSLAEYLVAQGTVVSLPESYYGWQDYDFKRSADNPVVAVLNVHEDSWSEFVHTFTGSADKVGVTGEALFKNGQNRKLRIEGSFGEVVKGITGQ